MPDYRVAVEVTAQKANGEWREIATQTRSYWYGWAKSDADARQRALRDLEAIQNTRCSVLDVIQLTKD